MPIALTGGTVSRPMPCQRFAPFAGGSAGAFRFTISSGGGLHRFTLPLTVSGTYNFEVDWGDGNTDTITVWNQAQATHTYASNAHYQISITGTMTDFSFNGSGDCAKLLSIDEWADTGLALANGFCHGCTNLTSVAEMSGQFFGFNSPVAQVTSARLMFAYCTSLVTMPTTMFLDSCADFTSFFEGCTSLTDAGYIEVGNGVTFDRMYYGCTSLATLNNEMQHFGSHATTMIEMFKNCTSLTTIPSNVFDYGVDFTSMFEGCTAFNGFSNVGFKASATTLNSMCANCSAMTSATPRGGSDMTGVSSATSMFNGCSSLTSIALGFGSGGNVLTGIVASCSALTNFSLGNITNDIDLSNCPIISGSEMNTIFSSLDTSAHTITITGTPAATQTGCTPSTATGKGWTVVQDTAVALNPTITDLGGSVRFNFNASLGAYATAHSQIEYQINAGGWNPTTDGGSTSASSGDVIDCRCSDVNSAGSDGGFYGTATYTVP